MTSPSTLPEAAEAFLAALDHEIEAVLADPATSADKVSLRDGKRVREGADEEPHEYRFTCSQWKRSFDSEDLLVRPSRSKEPWAYATARAEPNGKVLVETRANLGNAPGNVQLRKDETRLQASLADRIRDCAQERGPVNLTTAGWVLGEGDPPLGRVEAPERLIDGFHDLDLNKHQGRAVETALGSGITFLWGPPGTGKTKVVSLIAEGAYRAGERVLFLAPTNVAVDQALEKVCERLEQEEGYDAGLVQRAGAIVVDSLRAHHGSSIDPELIAGRLGEELTRRANELEEYLSGAAREQAAHERLARAERALSGAQEQQRKVAAELDRTSSRIESLRVSLTQAAEAIRGVGSPTGLGSGRKARRIAALTEKESSLKQELAQTRETYTDLARRRGAVSGDVDDSAREHSSALEATEGLTPPKVLEGKVARADKELTGVREELDGLKKAVRKRCRVMGATLSKALHSRSLMDDVDTVVIDEAGMVDLPSAWCAAGLAGKRVVVAGDFRQLPSITHASDSEALGEEAREHSRRWMDRDAFHAAGLVDEGGRVVKDPRLVGLDTQYRMRPDICAVVNEVAYRDAPLETGRKDHSQLPSSPLLGGSVVLVDTSSRRVPAGRYGAQRSNEVHEAVIHELVRGLQYDSVLPGRKHEDAGSPADLMAVIAPYRDQVTRVGKSLGHRFGTPYEGLADTVHRFQGSQRPLVVLDTVAGAGKDAGYFYAGTGLSSTTTRLLNVALSRSQDHLVVVADVSFLREHLSAGSETLRMLDSLERSAKRIPVEELVPIRSAGDLAGLSDEERERPAFFPADEVDLAVEWDLDHAAESVEVYCAFLNVQPVRRWLKRFSRQLDRGIGVTVFTRPPSDFSHEQGERQHELTERLRAAGCQVVTRPRMHEKVVILDRAVLWHGSLNLLATRGATDLMMRVTNPDACARVRRIVENAKQDRPVNPPDRWQGSTGDGEGSEEAPAVGKVVNGRLYLNVPREEKDIAKREVRARWHREVKLWWVSPDTPREKITRWL